MKSITFVGLALVALQSVACTAAYKANGGSDRPPTFNEVRQNRARAARAAEDSPESYATGDGYAFAQETFPEGSMSLNKPWPGCSRGPFTMQLRNNTDSFLELTLNDSTLRAFDGNGELPSFLPPHAIGYVCLEETGTQVLTSRRYAVRMGELVEIEGSEVTEELQLSNRTPNSGMHRVRISTVGFSHN